MVRLSKIFNWSTGTWSFVRGGITGAALLFSFITLSPVTSSSNDHQLDISSRISRDLTDNSSQRVSRATSRFAEALSLVEIHHVQKSIDDELVSEMLKGALGVLDDFSGYLNKEEAASLTSLDSLESRPRLGVTIMDVDGRYVVESVVPGSPAEISGLMPGDTVVRVNGGFVGMEDPQSINQLIQEQIRKEPKGEFSIGVERYDGRGEQQISIVPDYVRPIGAYDLGREANVSHIFLERFYEGASDDVREIVSREHRDSPLDGVIIDLRNNGGGLTSEVRRLASLFLPEGSLLYEMKGRRMGVEEIYSEGEPEFPDLRVSIIVNGYSASASEIFAGALQAHKRGEVIGWRTLGKGTVQRVYPVDDGAIKITVAQYRDGGMRLIEDEGVHPDHEVAKPDPHHRPSRFAVDEAREIARKLAREAPYVASQ